MPVLTLVFLVIILTSWLFTQILATIPFYLLHSLGSLCWASVGILLLLILGWFFGE